MTQRRRPDPEADFPYADAGRILRESLGALLPPLRISVADHAAQHRWVKSRHGAHLERWDHATAPYLVEPMEALTEEGVETVAMVGPAASGKTVGTAENWLLHVMHADPGDMLWYMQKEPAAEAYVKSQIEPMLEAHEHLIGDLKVGRDSVHMKRFRGGRVEFLGFTHSNLVNKHVRYIVADEWDAYDETLGDPEALLNPRRQAAGADSRLLAISHPDLGLPISAPIERQRGIMKLYAGSDRRTWWWGCPHCNGYSSPNPGTSRRMVMTWPEDAPLDVIEAEARLLCPCCERKIEDRDRQAMNATGRWIGAGEEIDIDGRVTGQRIRRPVAGFWIVGVMSPFVLGGIGRLARLRVAAERAVAAGAADTDLRTVMVKGWGETYAPPRQVGTVDAQALAERVEPNLPLRVVPEGVRVLTAFVDVQGGRFELLARGWGPGMESWVVDHRVIEAEPATSAEDWDALMLRLSGLAYPLADGSGRYLRVRCAAFDSMGQAGVTEQAFAAWRRARAKGLTRSLGKVDGRDAWTLLPTKGASALQAPRLTLAYPNSQRKDRRSGARGIEPLLIFNPNGAKDALAAQLARIEPGPSAVHFPAGLLAKEPPHPFFEQLAAERRKPNGAWEKIGDHLRNEAVDLMVGAEVAARLHGVHRIAWDRPPAWATPWDSNSMVMAAPPVATVAEPAAGAAGAAGSAAAAAGGRGVAEAAAAPPPAPGPNLAALRQALLRRTLGGAAAASARMR
jgi:phage terminase large subunit GpA-like protein